MKELFFLATAPLKSITEWPEGTFLGICLLICYALLIVAIVMILVLFYWIADSSFLSVQKTNGVVIGKEFTPEHDELKYNVVLKMPTTTTIPDSWEVTVRVTDGREASIEVEKSFYDSVKEGSAVAVDYSNGRFSGGLYLEEIFMM